MGKARNLILWFSVLGTLAGGGAFGWSYFHTWWKDRTAPKFRTAQVVRGDIVYVVNATGTVNPVLSIRVGSFTSGPVKRLYVDFNSRVKKDAILAEIDPTLYEAVVRRDEAALSLAKAEVARVESLLRQAARDKDRAAQLRKKNPDYLSEMEMDKFEAIHDSLKAQLGVAKAQVLQAEANLKNSVTNLGYTKITSPVEGMVIDRKIDEGQTLVAQFQVPDLFVVAPNLEKEIDVYASIDEADVGLILDAQRRGNPVRFSVDAYPDELFEGKIFQVRMNPTSKENVVTYNVVVSTPNPQMKLLPGMTAKLSFEIEKRAKVVKVPNAALRYYPAKIEYVREEDRAILEATEESAETDAGADKTTDTRSAEDRVREHRSASRRYVWAVDGDCLRAIEVTTGLNDHKYTEAVSGEIQEGLELVVGVKK